MPENIVSEEARKQYLKASMAIDKENYAYAIELLTHLINIRPDFADARQLLRLAEIKNFDKNRPNILIYALRRILSFLRVFAALVFETSGNYHKAISIYENILRKDPKNTVIMIRLGNILKIEGLKEASAVTLESVINISQKNSAAYGMLGEVYSELGNYDRARFCLKKVLELKPHDAAAEKGLKNLDALTTIDKSFEKKDRDNFGIREVKD